MGTNCVLRSLDSPSYQDFRQYDLETTSVEHGFRVTGYCLMKDNTVEEHVCEDFTYSRSVPQVITTFRKLLTCTHTGCLLGPPGITVLIDRVQALYNLIS
jgi:hypothetical protein